MNEDRDAKICQLYREGSTQNELANLYHLTPARIGKIICKAGMTPADRLGKKSDRTSFMGVHLTRGVKEAVRQVAAEDDTTMSEWVSNIIIIELKARGVSIEVTSDIETKPLPFEEPAHEL